MQASSVSSTCRRGRALIGLKRFGAAAEALERSLALSPGDAGAQQVWCPTLGCPGTREQSGREERQSEDYALSALSCQRTLRRMHPGVWPGDGCARHRAEPCVQQPARAAEMLQSQHSAPARPGSCVVHPQTNRISKMQAQRPTPALAML
jgi:hypothetical protein